MLGSAVKYLVVALVLAGTGLVILLTGRVERRLAQADQDLATLNLSRAARGYDAVADSLAWPGRLPGLFRGTRREVATSQAAVRYWRGDHASLVSEFGSANSPSIGDNVGLQLIVANADFLSALRPDASRELALGALDQAVGIYRRLLETSDSHFTAAFNYELVVRLRNRIAAGDGVPDFQRPTVPGTPGEDPEEEMMEDVQIYVPRDRLVDPDETDDPTIGEGAPIRKRG